MCGICYQLSRSGTRGGGGGGPCPMRSEWEVQAIGSRGPSSYSAHTCRHTTTNNSTTSEDATDHYGAACDTIAALRGAAVSGDDSGTTTVTLSGAVLHLQGATSSVNRQPYPPPTSSTTVQTFRSLLLWNGEVFGGSEVVPAGSSDTSVVYSRLLEMEERVLNGYDVRSGDDMNAAVVWERFMEAVGSYLEGGAILGPYAFIYLPHRINAAIGRYGACVFGRDPVGRRSLVVSNHYNDCDMIGSLIISSVCAITPTATATTAATDNADVTTTASPPQHPLSLLFPQGTSSEVPTKGIYGAHTTTTAGDTGLVFTCRPWDLDNQTHPLLLPLVGGRPTWRSMVVGGGGRKDSNNKYSRRVVDWVLSRVGYTHNPNIDCPLPHALAYLYALAEAVHRRVDLSTRTLDDDATSSSPTSSSVVAVVPPVMVLFSGGIDCTVLAALAHYLLPPTTPLELANVAFGGGANSNGDAPSSSSSALTSKGASEFHAAPDRLTGYLSFAELATLPTVPDHIRTNSNTVMAAAGGSSTAAAVVVGEKRWPEGVNTDRRDWRLVEVDVTPELLSSRHEHIMRLVAPRCTVMDHNIGSALWFGARGVGKMVGADAVLKALGALGDGCGGTAVRHGATSTIPPSTTTTPPSSSPLLEDSCFDALVEVLVEEGAELLPDGVTVQPTMVLLATLGKEYGERLAPAWRGTHKKLGFFIDAASHAGRVRIVKVGGHATGKGVQLVNPLDIGRARAITEKKEVHLKAMGGGRPYECSARVVLMGMGADETCGGYVRHQRAVSRGGMEGLRTELQRDFERLWERNLGRDDRVVSDSGREGRFPFLDEDVLAVLASPDVLPLSSVCEFELPTTTTSATSTLTSSSSAVGPGVGDKKVIRTISRMLGLGDASRLQKRAIQFGTRIADSKMQGSAKLSEME